MSTKHTKVGCSNVKKLHFAYFEYWHWKMKIRVNSRFAHLPVYSFLAKIIDSVSYPSQPFSQSFISLNVSKTGALAARNVCKKYFFLHFDLESLAHS